MVGGSHGAAVFRSSRHDRLSLRRFAGAAQRPAHPRAEPLFRRGQHRPQCTYPEGETLPVRRHAVAHGANRRGHGCHRRSLCRGRHLRTDDQPGVFEPDAPGDKLPPEPAAAAPAPGTQGAGQSILVLGLPVLVPVDKLFQPQPRQAAHGTLHEPLATGLLRQVVPG